MLTPRPPRKNAPSGLQTSERAASRMRTNIKKVLHRADAVDISEGRVAYYRYREVCCRVAERYGYPVESIIACFAALSPNLDYRGNVRSLLSVVEGHKAGRPVETIKTAGYNACRDRAYSYLSGVSFWDTVHGPKIRAFYQNILHPMSAEYVTIDGHAVNIVYGKVRPLKEVVRSKWKYPVVAEAYKVVAAKHGLIPNQLQAITWFTWKRINNIVYTAPQLHLFDDRQNDFWQTLLTYENVRAYDGYTD